MGRSRLRLTSLAVRGFRMRRGMFSGLLARLLLLVLMFILMTLPEPADSGFAST